MLHNLDSGFLRGTPEGQDERRGKEGGRRDRPHPCQMRRDKGQLNKEWEGQGGWRECGSQKGRHLLVMVSWSYCGRTSPAETQDRIPAAHLPIRQKQPLLGLWESKFPDFAYGFVCAPESD